MEVVRSRVLIRPADLERTLDFYGRGLGLATAYEFGDGDGRGVVFFAGGGFLEVVGPSTTGVGRLGGSDPISLWFQVRDVVGAVAEITGRGVSIARPPLLEPWGLVEAWVDDPDGLRIHLVEVPEGHPLRNDPRDPTGGDPAVVSTAEHRHEGGPLWT